MQTFLPYASFELSAGCLDRQRLGKQRVEVLQLLKALLVPGSGWANHPAALMWQGYELSLCYYGMDICREWQLRGYKDTCYDKISAIKDSPAIVDSPNYTAVYTALPPWLGDSDFHASHRSNLLRKDSVWYGRFGWSEPDDLPYVWPVIAKAEGKVES